MLPFREPVTGPSDRPVMLGGKRPVPDPEGFPPAVGGGPPVFCAHTTWEEMAIPIATRLLRPYDLGGDGDPDRQPREASHPDARPHGSTPFRQSHYTRRERITQTLAVCGRVISAWKALGHGGTG